EELGDVLLQVMFHSQMEEENGNFNFNDVSNDICKKLIVRHPHVFGDVKIKNTDDVLNNWAEIKKAQKGQNQTSQTLDCVPKQLPALMRSQKINNRVKHSVFCEKTKQQVFDELTNEFSEFSHLIKLNDEINATKKLGDILFITTNAIRLLKQDSEEILTNSCDKFIKQFTIAENLAQQNGLSVEDIDCDVAKQLWKKAEKMSIQED
ncbi:MAG: MazG family protein, partial [Oscillospiraceae bacterium]